MDANEGKAGDVGTKSAGTENGAPLGEAYALAVIPQEPGSNGGRGRLLCNCSSKKGPSIWAFSIGMPGGKCPYASDICSRNCYANVGKFPLNRHMYERNYRATREDGFAVHMRDEIVALAWRNSCENIGVCIHEKGDLHGLTYLRQWGWIMRELRTFPNLRFFVYTRCWVCPALRVELDRIADECHNARIHLSVDREMVAQRGLPHRVGDGLLVHLAETDEDLPHPGVDLVVRNLRIRNHAPMERLGGVRVCPNESGLFVALKNGLPVVKGGRTIPVRCMDCRICIDRTQQRWDQIKNIHAGTPRMPATGATAAQPDEKHVADARQRR